MNTSDIKRINTRHCGSALPLALLAVVVMFVGGVGLLRIGYQGRVQAIRETNVIQARAAADAGLAQALHSLNESFDSGGLGPYNMPSAANQGVVGSGSTFSYSVTTTPSGSYVIESVGNAGAAVRSVSSGLSLRGPFEYALFADKGIDLTNATTVDWYGDPGSSSLAVGTNSTKKGAITLKNSTRINGDVAVGVGGDPDTVIDLKNASSITGNTYAMAEEYVLESVVVPAALRSLPSSGKLEESVTLTGSKRYSSIDLKNNNDITIAGPVSLYVEDDLKLGNSSEVKILNEPGASLVLYVGGKIDTKNSSIFNNLTKVPARFKIFGLDGCDSIVLKNNAALYGAIYAPKAKLTLHNSADIYGSITVEEYTQKNSAVFRYPASLREAAAGDPLVRLKIKTWEED
ncbi:MAG: hypothetical protein JW720_16155 [Sedimentisphaerales bacterium]|nr:hypothetical protein [Sedimentisphaerales bacterium]